MWQESPLLYSPDSSDVLTNIPRLLRFMLCWRAVSINFHHVFLESFLLPRRLLRRSSPYSGNITREPLLRHVATLHSPHQHSRPRSRRHPLSSLWRLPHVMHDERGAPDNSSRDPKPGVGWLVSSHLWSHQFHPWRLALFTARQDSCLGGRKCVLSSWTRVELTMSKNVVWLSKAWSLSGIRQGLLLSVDTNVACVMMNLDFVLNI